MPATAIFLMFLASVAPKFDSPAPTGTRMTPTRGHAATCKLVGRMEAELELGHRLEPGTEESEGAEESCEYQAGPEGEAVVRISVQQLEGSSNAVLEIANLKAAFPEASVCAIPNLGGTAVLVQIPGAVAQLHVMMKNGKYVMVSALGFGDTARVAAGVQALARKALSRI